MNAPIYCLIGGNGFIGRALRRHLALRGAEVIIIGRSLNAETGPREQYYSLTEYSFRQLEELLMDRPPEAVIDLAYTSVPGTSYDDPIRDFSENLYNVIRHLEFVQRTATRRFVYVSSGGTVYGESDGSPLKETAPNFPLSPYGVTKLACERYVYMYHRLHGLPGIVVRPSNIYGPGQLPFRGQGLIATAMGLARQGAPIHIFGDGTHVRDYLYIDDFCTALLQVTEQGAPGTLYNAGSGKGITINEIVESISEVVRRQGFDLAAIRQPARAFDVHANTLDTTALRTATGWQPATSLAEGLEETWNWMLKQPL